MSLLGTISSAVDKVGTAAVNMLPAATINYSAPQAPQTPQTAQTAQTPPQAQYHVPGRNLTLSDADLSVLRPVLYGEISNRNSSKKELEARVIFNTALNRMKAYADRGETKSLADVLSAPNQYQAYGGKQYQTYSNPGDASSTAKKQQVDQIVQKFLNEMEGGNFPDVTNGAYYYQHTPSGTIQYDNSRQLFAGGLGMK